MIFPYVDGDEDWALITKVRAALDGGTPPIWSTGDRRAAAEALWRCMEKVVKARDYSAARGTADVIFRAIEEEYIPDLTRRDERDVYFAQKGDQVKIGVSGNPEARIRQLRTASPGIRLIAVFPCGGRPVEKALHQEFASHRIEGEWFRWSQKMADAIRTNPYIRTAEEYLNMANVDLDPDFDFVDVEP